MPQHPTHPRIPESLRPYIRLPRRDSLTLVTGVLGATTNWIVLRFIGAAVARSNTSKTSDAGPGKGVSVGTNGNEEMNGVGNEGKTGSAKNHVRQNEVAVVLVSWMRDLEFWRTEGMKAVVSIMFIIS